MSETPFRKFMIVEVASVASVAGIVVCIGAAKGFKTDVAAVAALWMGLAAGVATFPKGGWFRNLIALVLATLGIQATVAGIYFGKVAIQNEIATVQADKVSKTIERDSVVSEKEAAEREVQHLTEEAARIRRELAAREGSLAETEIAVKSLENQRTRLSGEVESLRAEAKALRDREEATNAAQRRARADADLAAAKKEELEQANAKAKAIADAVAAKEKAVTDAEAEAERKIRQITGTIPKYPKIASGAVLKKKGSDQLIKCRWQKAIDDSPTYYLAYAANGDTVIVDPRDAEIVTLPFEGAEITYARALTTDRAPVILIDEGRYVTVVVRDG